MKVSVCKGKEFYERTIKIFFFNEKKKEA